MPKVSVIVPVYKVENYIERCARSLFEQTLGDIEFIFVDDCSPDESIKKLELTLEDYPERKTMTRIIKMPLNSGQAAVRRQGIFVATGDYVIHCDSDDWCERDMYEKMYDYAISEDFDIVWCDYFRSDGIHHRIVRQACKVDKEEQIKSFLSSRLIASVWNRLYKRRLQMFPDFVHPSDNMTEDFVISLQLVLRARKIGYLPQPLYYYFTNTSSICMTASEDKVLSNFQGLLRNTSIIFDTLDKAGWAQKCKTEIECKKCLNKDFLRPVLGKKVYRQLWRKTYPEVNRAFLFNPFVHFSSKVRAAFLLLRIYPLYTLLLSLLKRNA